MMRDIILICLVFLALVFMILPVLDRLDTVIYNQQLMDSKQNIIQTQTANMYADWVERTQNMKMPFDKKGVK